MRGCVCVHLRKKKMRRGEAIEFIVHGEERDKKRSEREINKIINTHATAYMHGYCSNCVFIHKFTPTDVGDFLLKLCKRS